MGQLRIWAGLKVRTTIVWCVVGTMVGMGALVASPMVALGKTSHQKMALDKRFAMRHGVRTCGRRSRAFIVYSIELHTCTGQQYMPTSVATGSDGALWFTTYTAGVIGRTTTAGVTSLYPVPEATGAWGNGGITTGSDGALWFLAYSGSAIGRMTTSGSVTTFPLSEGYSSAVTSGPDGALWFTVNNNSGPNGIGRLTTSGQMTIFTDPSLGTANWNSANHQFLWNITSGPNGALWFSMEYASNDLSPAWIGTITTSGVVTTYLIPFAADPSALTAGPDGAIWFGNFLLSEIGRMTTTGQFSEFSAPLEAQYVLGITAGPDGAVWFTNDADNPVPPKNEWSRFPPIGRITPNGTITTYGNGQYERGAMSITAGPDGAMWFIDHVSDTIGRINVP